MNMLNKGMVYLGILGLIACSEPDRSKIEPEVEKIQLPSSTPNVSVEASKSLTFADIPNKDTVYETIETNSIDENDTLMTHLQTQLLKDQFDLFEKESGNSWSENDCDKNRIIRIKGEGIRSYRGVSKVKIGDEKKYIPDFIMLVFTFDNEQLAQQHFITIDSAVGSGSGFCNGKAPEQLVLNGREIFYFTTRAEMFRTYINKYAEIVKQFKTS